MKKLIASCFAVVAVTLAGCAAPDYGGGMGGQSPFLARARKKSAYAATEEAAPTPAWTAPAEPVAAPAPPPPPPPPAPAPSIIGIGAGLQMKDGVATISAITPGGPAAKDGRLRVGDVMTAVAQGDGPWAPTEGMSKSQIAALVRGDSGTIVRLKVLRGDQALTVSLVRASIDLNAAPAEPGSAAAAAAESPAVPAARAARKDAAEILDQLAP
jgi:hypothetical protein